MRFGVKWNHQNADGPCFALQRPYARRSVAIKGSQVCPGLVGGNMLTAHLAAGYCVTGLYRTPGRAVIAAALVGGVLPDLDLAFFYLVDERSLHHHRYWVHVPAFWMALGVLILPLARYGRCFLPASAFLVSIMFHLLLDSIAGGIMWLYPLDNTLYRAVVVPPDGRHRVVTFLTHWTILLELLVWLSAAVLFCLRRKRFGALWNQVSLCGISEPRPSQRSRQR